MVTPPNSRAALSFAWAGGAAFVMSLGWFLYCYLFRFDEAADTGRRTMAIAIDVGLFSIFAFHHSLLARPRAKALVQQLASPELERSIYTWVASLLFIGVCTWWRAVPGVAYELAGIWRLLAYGAQAIGLILTVQASRALDVLDLAGVRPVLRAATAASRPDAHVPLKTHGIYGFVRHPLYFAWALFVFATPDMTGTRAVFAVVSTAYLALAIPWEERSLVASFGEQYEAYRRQVRWRMIPGLY